MSAVMQCIEHLTERESEVLRLMCAGKVNKVIAHELGISERTLDIYRQSVCQKLGAKTHAQLGVIAAREGLIAPRA